VTPEVHARLPASWRANLGQRTGRPIAKFIFFDGTEWQEFRRISDGLSEVDKAFRALGLTRGTSVKLTVFWAACKFSLEAGVRRPI